MHQILARHFDVSTKINNTLIQGLNQVQRSRHHHSDMQKNQETCNNGIFLVFSFSLVGAQKSRQHKTLALYATPTFVQCVTSIQIPHK